MLELSWNGKEPLAVGQEKRTFIEDHDAVRLTAYCQGNGYTIGFGDCVGQILPADSQ